MCKEYIIDAFDLQTIVAKKEIIKCMKEAGLNPAWREWGNYVIVELDSLPPMAREEYVKYVLANYAKRPRPRPKVDKKEPKPQKQEILVKWDLPRRRSNGARTIVSVYLPLRLVERLDKIAKEHGLSRSELITRVLEAFLDAYESNK